MPAKPSKRSRNRRAAPGGAEESRRVTGSDIRTLGTDFAPRLIRWQRDHGRHDLPWQASADPYRVWLSEVMLQQTQVKAVIPYYERFLDRFPDVRSLAAAPLDAVMQLWSGLGYYSRARNLHKAAQAVVERHAGAFPQAFDDVVALPGVGRSTAAAICAFSYGTRHAILDGNVKRVLCRSFGIAGFPGAAPVERRLWQLAEDLLPAEGVGAYTQALMDLGATICVRSRPSCERCPLRPDCVAHCTGRVGELPEPRPRRERPLRRKCFLILLHAGEVLLERRPPSGIWGGLWSLPETERAEDATRIALHRYGVRVEDVVELPVLTHGFTHYQLDIRPLRMRVAAIDPAARAPGHVWIPLSDLAGAALPAPVRTLLDAQAEWQDAPRGRMRTRA